MRIPLYFLLASSVRRLLISSHSAWKNFPKNDLHQTISWIIHSSCSTMMALSRWCPCGCAGAWRNVGPSSSNNKLYSVPSTTKVTATCLAPKTSILCPSYGQALMELAWNITAYTYTHAPAHACQIQIVSFQQRWLNFLCWRFVCVFLAMPWGCVEVLLHGSSSSSSSQRTLTLEEVDVGLAQDPRAQWLFISAEGGHALEWDGLIFLDLRNTGVYLVKPADQWCVQASL